MKNWIEEAIFYHIYPLGFCDAPRYHEDVTTHRLTKIEEWIPHMKQMGFNALYLGPIFESYEHGYDTTDYRCIDKRLGDHEDMQRLCSTLHKECIRVVFDGVFNHVGREFWAFQDVIKHREHSMYCNWFVNVRFDQNNPMNDGFTYDTWQGYYNLVKLNLKNEDVIQYLLDSVGMWMDEYHIDGLRLDAADCVDKDFFRRLKQFCKQKDEHFWLMGEIIHGDYTLWANNDMLDSVTNYECYKGLYSSHNDKNYFEIAHSLQRQFSKGGLYEGLTLYNFVDNHDVNRIASTLKDMQDACNVYTLLYTMPGIPSVYYGSEWALEGKKYDGSDADIRPSLEIDNMKDIPLTKHIQILNRIRKENPTLYYGRYESILIKNEQFVFLRQYQDETIYIALNVSEQPCEVTIESASLYDILNKETFVASNQQVNIQLPGKSSRIMMVAKDCTQHVTAMDDKAIKKDIESIIEERPSSSNQMEQLHIEETPLKIGRYEHFKGKHYSVLYVASHSETLESYVVYRQLYGNEGVWIRPLSMFLEEVEVDGHMVPRFKYIGN